MAKRENIPIPAMQGLSLDRRWLEALGTFDRQSVTNRWP
jgi:hypothetical protein